jgi:hypothetical protein
MRRKFSVGQKPIPQTTPDAPKNFRQCRSAALQKIIRRWLLAARYSLFTVFPDLPISRFADKFCEALRRKLTSARSYGSPKGCNPKVLNRS